MIEKIGDSLIELNKEFEKACQKIGEAFNNRYEEEREKDFLTIRILMPDFDYLDLSETLFCRLSDTNLAELTGDKLETVRKILKVAAQYYLNTDFNVISKGEIKARLSSLEEKQLARFSRHGIPSGKTSQYIYNDEISLEEEYTPVHEYNDELQNYFNRTMETSAGELVSLLRNLTEEITCRQSLKRETAMENARKMCSALNEIVGRDYFSPGFINPVINYDECIYFNEINPILQVKMDTNFKDTLLERLKGWNFHYYLDEDSISYFRKSGRDSIRDMIDVTSLKYCRQVNNYFYPFRDITINILNQLSDMYFPEYDTENITPETMRKTDAVQENI